MQLFAQVQIIEEDTRALRDFSRHLNDAFAPLASSFNRSDGRDKQCPTALQPKYNKRESHVASVDEFVEEPEDEKPSGLNHEAHIRLVSHNR